MSPRPAHRLALLAPAWALLLLTGCVGTRKLADPVLVIRAGERTELGVSTDYGIVFLGRSAAAGPIEITAWFGDGPSIEDAVVEPLGAGLFTAETEIRLPQVEMSFDEPRPGDRLLVLGRRSDGPWRAEVTARSDPRVLGILTTIPAELESDASQVGAGVYVLADPDDENTKRLIGLVSGRITLASPGGEASYLTVVGPTDLWRLVAHRRELVRRKRWIYREDIL